MNESYYMMNKKYEIDTHLTMQHDIMYKLICTCLSCLVLSQNSQVQNMNKWEIELLSLRYFYELDITPDI
jgi:hypothetical protein